MILFLIKTDFCEKEFFSEINKIDRKKDTYDGELVVKD